MTGAIVVIPLLLTGVASAHGAVATCWARAATEADRSSCAESQYAETDRELNAVYTDALAKGNRALRQGLQKAERTWLAYRDAHVASTLAASVSSARSSCKWIILSRVTRERTTALKKLLRGLSGDDLCAREEGEPTYEAADKSLNEVYGKVLGKAGGNRQSLQKAERAWLGYRDADVTSLLAASSASGADRAACERVHLARITTARTHRLVTTFLQYEGETPCAVAEAAAPQLASAEVGCAAGQPGGCLTLGNAHQWGWFLLDEDPSQAVNPYRTACAAAVPDACVALASLYSRGAGVGRDRPRAAELYERACEEGSSVGCESLAWAYVKGVGLPKDTAKALRAWQRACCVSGADPHSYQHGLPCQNLGGVLERGDPLPRDLERARAAYEKACEAQQAWSCLRAAQLLRAGSRTPAETSRMVSLYERGCKGYETREACMELGDMYRDGDGVPKDVGSALSLYKPACEGSFIPGCRAARALSGEPPPGDPDDEIAEAGYIMTVRVVVHPKLPGMRLRLFGDDYGVVLRIDVFDEGRREVTDRLLVPRGENEMPQHSAGGVPIVRAADLNFDGYDDLMLLDWWGATGNKGYLVWLFDPTTGRFVFSHELDGLSNLEPHPTDGTLTTFTTGGHAGAICGGERYRWMAGHPVIVRRVSQDWDAKTQDYIRIIEDFDKGRLVRRDTHRSPWTTVRVERFRDGTSIGVQTVRDAPAEEPQRVSPCWVP